MSPDEWRACEDPSAMLDLVGDRATDRKLRLFLVACCLRIWPMLADERSRAAVNVAQRFADGTATATELAAAHEAARAALADKAPGAPANATAPRLEPSRGKLGYDRNRPVMLDVREGASRAVSCVANNRASDATCTWAETVRDERSFQASVLRDIFGYPYPFVGDPIAFDELAAQYQDRLFDTVCRLVGNSEDAAEIVRESFRIANQTLADFNGDSQFFTWLYRIAVNAAITHKRRQKTGMKAIETSSPGFDPAWRTPQAIELATEIYTKPLFNRMRDLGDLLQDAGCESAVLLSHCRSRAMHFRGCWLVDLVLGRD